MTLLVAMLPVSPIKAVLNQKVCYHQVDLYQPVVLL